MPFHLPIIDFERHNEEAKRVWEAYHAGRPYRAPVMISANSRICLLNPALNEEGIGYREYIDDPDLMALVQMKTQHYIRHNLLQDAEMGLPEAGWSLTVDFQNCYDALWFGAEIEFRDGQVPDTKPLLSDCDPPHPDPLPPSGGRGRKRVLFDRGIPDPFAGEWMERNWRYYEHWKANLSRYEFAGRPAVSATPSGLGCDGVFTVAANLRGATQLCLDIYEDPDYVRELLDYVNEALIARIKAYREALGQEMKPQCGGFADDCIELLSTDTYRELVLPYHKRYLSELFGEGPHSVHLCGNVERHMPIIRDELNVRTWDAGFPLDYGAIRKALGPDFQIQTGPRVSTLLNGSVDDVDAECKRILESGIMEGGRFILHEANNLSPRTPVENVAAMYEAAARYGRDF